MGRRKPRFKPRNSAAYKRYYDNSRGRKERGGFFDQLYDLSDETKRAITSIILIVLGIVIILSLFDLAGSFGQFTSHYLGVGLGFGKWYLPLFLIIFGYFLARPGKYDVGPLQYISLALLILTLNGFIHLMVFHQTSRQILDGAIAGRGGGFAGWLTAYPLFTTTGFLASSVILAALIIISLFLLFNTSFTHISEKGGGLKSGFSDLLVKMRVKKMQDNDGKTRDEQDEDDESEFEERSLDIDVEEEEAEEQDGEEFDEEEPTAPRQPAGDDVKVAGALISTSSRKVDMPIDLLNGKAGKPTSGDIKASQYIIRKTLENFRIDAEMSEVNIGPTVTQYTLKPSEGVKLSKIVGLSDNLALALAAHPIRIEAPIPGRSLVGIEVPNQSTAIVPLKEVLKSESFSSRASNLMLSLGQDVKGHAWLADLGKMPHLLIAGATGSGKSVCINTVILGLLFQNSPDELKFIMVDPKRVELPMYNDIPHLLTPVITNVKKTVNALKWSIGEMERRFEKLSEFHKRDIGSYNRDMPDKMPYIVLVIDELADLMAAAGAEIEGYIIRLAQMSRAVGIHLIIATQRPSVDVLTGLIKANIPSRIAFSVASLIDSRTILDAPGAEKLLGRGDMLYISTDISKPKRLQGAFATDNEIKRVIDHLKKQGKPEYLEEITEKQVDVGGVGMDGRDPQDSDPLLEEAKQVILRAGKASASLLQRRLRVGYARAARLLDLLEAQGIIGPADGAKPREVLIKEGMDDTMEQDDSDYEQEEEDEQEPRYEDEEEDDEGEDQEDEDEQEEDEEGDEDYEEEYEEEDQEPRRQ